MKVEDLLTRSEGKTLEFKQDLSSPKNILKTVVTFANTAGGIVLIEIADVTSAVLGVENPIDNEEPMPDINPDKLDVRISSGLIAGLSECYGRALVKRCLQLKGSQS